MDLISAFIKINKRLISETFIKRVFIMGNTSCDMDSVLSSILLAFALNISSKILEPKLNSNKELNILSKNVIYLPLINTEDKLFPSKLDITFLFKLNLINYSDLIFINQLKDISFNNINERNLILVDHNKLDPQQEAFADSVVAIYDHHEDSNIKYINLKEKVLVYPMASCTTIILMNHYLSNKDLMNHFSNNNLELLCAAIWLDSKGFEKNLKYNRWIDLDFYVFENLGSYGKINKSIFDELEKCKFDEKANLELGIDFLMNKDLKNFKYSLSAKYLSMIDSDLISSGNSNLIYNLDIKWASLFINYYKLKEHFGEETLHSYFQGQECQLFVTNSDYNKDKKILTFYFNYNNTFFNKKMAQLFITSFLKDVTENTVEVIDTKISNFHTIEMSMKISRKNLEPIIKKHLEM